MNIFLYAYRWFWWNILSKTFIAIHLKPKYNFRLTPDSDKYPRPPFLVIANHGTFFDPWLVGKFSPYPFIIMVNDDGFREKSISRFYLQTIGAIPKKKGASDYKAMKMAIDSLNKKLPVCIFPEGQTSWNGETQLLYRGFEKIIKKKNCPVMIIKLRGNFLIKPWWADHLRKGRILISQKVMTPEQFNQYTPDQLFTVLKNSIYQNDIRDPENLIFPFSGSNLAEGLERFLWICMKCKCEDTLITHGDTFSCSNCGASWRIDAHCRIFSNGENTPSFSGDLQSWSEFHKKIVIEKLNSGEEGILTKSEGPLLLVENDEFLFDSKGKGELSLTGKELSFKSATEKIVWQVSNIQDYTIQKKDIFEFLYEGKHYRFVFNKKSPMKWIYYFRYLNGFSEIEKRGYY